MRKQNTTSSAALLKSKKSAVQEKQKRHHRISLKLNKWRRENIDQLKADAVDEAAVQPIFIQMMDKELKSLVKSVMKLESRLKKAEKKIYFSESQREEMVKSFKNGLLKDHENNRMRFDDA